MAGKGTQQDFYSRMKDTEKTLQRKLEPEEFAFLAVCNGFSEGYIKKVTGVEIYRPLVLYGSNPSKCRECGGTLEVTLNCTKDAKEVVCGSCGVVAAEYDSDEDPNEFSKPSLEFIVRRK
jgi:hypothetical protein